MNRSRTAKNQTRESLFQKLTGKLCPIPLIRGSDSYAKPKNTCSNYLDLERSVSSTSNHSARNVLTLKLSKTLRN